MVSLNKVVNIIFVLLLCLIGFSEGFSQVTGAQRVCGPATMTPTGPVVPAGQFTIPAVIKPILSACAPSTPEEPTDCPAPAPRDDCDDEDPYDTLLYLLINRILDSKKSPGKRSGSCKSGGTDGCTYSGAGDAGYAADGAYCSPAFGSYAGSGADGPGAFTCRSISDAS